MRRHILDSPVSYHVIYYTVRLIPVGLYHLLGRVVALIVYAFSKKDRRGLAGNLSLALGRPSDDPVVRKTVRQVFVNYGRYMVDFFLLPQTPSHKLKRFFADIKGEQVLKDALAKGKGAVLLSAHVGNWEAGGSMMRMLDYPLAVVVMKHNTNATNDLVNRLRQSNGIRVIEVDRSPFSVIEVLRHLHNNGVVAMGGDRDYFNTGREVSFLGNKIKLPIGPVLLAMNSGAALIPAFVIKQPDGKYFGILEDPIPLACGPDRNQAIQKNLELTARTFEKYIRRYPDQWYCPDPLTQPLKTGTAP